VDVSSREEQVRLEDPTPEALENPLAMVDTLVNLQDPILENPENLATPANTLVGLQDLQEPIVTSSAISPSLWEPIVTSLAISPSLQDPIVTSSATDPSQEKVCYIPEPFVSFFLCTVLTFCLLSGSKPLGVSLI
jgi:hypothetical protein